MITAATARPGRTRRSWSSALLGGLGYLAHPVQAGAALLLLGLGVITWLPAAAAAAHALHRWRSDDDQACFTETFRAFPRYWRRLWGLGVVAAAGAALLIANLSFLYGRGGPAPILLLAQLGLIAVAVPYLLAVAVVAARAPDQATRDWLRVAAWFAFGSAARGTALLGAAVATPIVSIVVPAGPLLLGATVPLLVGLIIAEHTAKTSTA
ncbi:DUF624 domain-containing protein [Microlunatus parietis]|uniref:Putative membrane protein YesL n=1 Tax=Microlunatus parietis TaxID=682979 RepID=A0A7Y9I3F6_9ACTN|nr:DUF624 domain-containing protein [Microlunatus parietis]NYE69276.1 putative membrane protein YesL [Microlunatus parietis]